MPLQTTVLEIVQPNCLNLTGAKDRFAAHALPHSWSDRFVFGCKRRTEKNESNRRKSDSRVSSFWLNWFFSCCSNKMNIFAFVELKQHSYSDGILIYVDLLIIFAFDRWQWREQNDSPWFMLFALEKSNVKSRLRTPFFSSSKIKRNVIWSVIVDMPKHHPCLSITSKCNSRTMRIIACRAIRNTDWSTWRVVEPVASWHWRMLCNRFKVKEAFHVSSNRRMFSMTFRVKDNVCCFCYTSLVKVIDGERRSFSAGLVI